MPKSKVKTFKRNNNAKEINLNFHEKGNHVSGWNECEGIKSKTETRLYNESEEQIDIYTKLIPKINVNKECEFRVKLDYNQLIQVNDDSKNIQCIVTPVENEDNKSKLYRDFISRIKYDKKIDVNMNKNKERKFIIFLYIESAIRGYDYKKFLSSMLEYIYKKHYEYRLFGNLSHTIDFIDDEIIKNRPRDLSTVLPSYYKIFDVSFIPFNNEFLQELNKTKIIKTIDYPKLELKSRQGKENILSSGSSNIVITDVKVVNEDKYYKAPSIFKTSNGAKIVASIEDDESLYVI